MYTKAFRVLAALAIGTVAVAVNGCSNSGGGLGVAIPTEAQVVKLTDIMNDPAAYSGKQVVFKGRVSGQCPSLCEFFMKEGPHKVTIFPQGYEFPKLETGKPVTVYAAVTAGPSNVVLNALGVRFEKE